MLRPTTCCDYLGVIDDEVALASSRPRWEQRTAVRLVADWSARPREPFQVRILRAWLEMPASCRRRISMFGVIVGSKLAQRLPLLTDRRSVQWPSRRPTLGSLMCCTHSE